LAGVAFDGAEAGVVDYAVGKSGLTDAWGAVEEDNAGCSGGGLFDPFDEGVVMCAV
jgi:hypothetical protein